MSEVLRAEASVLERNEANEHRSLMFPLFSQEEPGP